MGSRLRAAFATLFAASALAACSSPKAGDPAADAEPEKPKTEEEVAQQQERERHDQAEPCPLACHIGAELRLVSESA